jgi:hypothetical protein
MPGAATSARPRSRARRASTTPGRSPRAPARSASCSPSSSGRSTPSTPPRGLAWTTCRCWDRSPCSSSSSRRRVRPPAGHRTVVLPRRLTNPGAVHQVPAQPGVPSRRRAEGPADGTGHRPERRAADQDQECPAVLLQAAVERLGLNQGHRISRLAAHQSGPDHADLLIGYAGTTILTCWIASRPRSPSPPPTSPLKTPWPIAPSRAGS